MITPERHLGRVSYAPNHQSCYVRINISKEDGVPLAIKASFSGFDYRCIKKGDWVEVRQTNPRDARCYGVTRFLKDVPPKEANPCSEIFADTKGDTVNITTEGTMKDRVRFWLSDYYFQRNNIYPVLAKAFDLSENHAREAARGPEEGFWIICRPDQFARFLIYRNKAGIKNGFMDLTAELFVPETPDYYAQLAQDHNIPRETVKAIIKSLGYGHEWLKGRKGHMRAKPTEIDVSQNPDPSSR